MKWSWKIVRLAGIDVYVHATFFILIAWIGLSFWMVSGNPAAVFSGVSFIIALFACVVLHELGHALTARRYGIRTRKIILLPIGGVADMERMPDDPKQEIAVALAGPAVNLVIAVVLWLWLSASGSLQTDQLDFANVSFLQKLMVVNIILAVFNLLPAFPMDGGRVLRAVLSMRMNHNRATQVAAKVGQGFALWLGLIGLLYNPFLLFIALFVWIGAAAEAGTEQIKSSLHDTAAGRAMLTDFQVLSPDDTLSHAIELTLAGSQKDFPVLVNKIMVGVLTQDDMLKGLQAQGEQYHVGAWMQKEIQSADINEPLEKVLERLQTCHCSLISVTEDDQLVGIINLDNIMELIKIQTAIHEQDGQTKFEA
ncbi:MAG: site-2 protease family protein [Pseudomonadota bacterium]|nr:site-2 protease family protein [Pseudomonadota bacterium]